ncbi:hypothetical protein AWC38_SpisGene10488 [Stylophora pistillata]|uniref:Mutator-like transposase domain-containing protein n=1 Tax=Stylophora pistillata TaxID=50429 RepID=A0A2B4S8N6_STYPI|nr:hypothetical protein AWC38_SpisGene10488 [Stylophora pistillata]
MRQVAFGKWKRSKPEKETKVERLHEGFKTWNAKMKLQYDNISKENEPPAKRMTRAREQNKAKRKANLPQGSRLVDLETRTDGLKECSFCHYGPLSLGNVIEEQHSGLASTFTVICSQCNAENTIKTSKEHRSGARGPLTFDVNTRAALGCLHTGVGNTHLNNLLSILTVPALNSSTFKNQEREAGKAIGLEAKSSCQQFRNLEREEAIENDITAAITEQQQEQYENAVPKYTSRPTVQKETFDDSKFYHFVLFDIETNSTGKSAEGCQLAAMDRASIDSASTRSTKPVCTILAGHNAATFDILILLRNGGENFIAELSSISSIRFADTLTLMKSLIKSKHSSIQNAEGKFPKPGQSSVYEHLFQATFDAHDALEDVIALRRILLSPRLALSDEMLVNRSSVISVKDAAEDLKYLDNRHHRLLSFRGKLYNPGHADSPIKQSIAEKNCWQ